MNLNFASVWEMIADLIPDNDALICGEEVVNCAVGDQQELPPHPLHFTLHS